jgi:hypothetical protein
MFTSSLIVEGANKKVLQFIMPQKSITINEQKCIFIAKNG